MTTAASALQQAVVAALSDDTALTGMLGGARIFDHVPRRVTPPYVAIAGSTVIDWSAGADRGAEVVLTLQVWSDLAGRSEVERIMGRVHELLDDREPALAGHRIVSLRHERTETRRLAEADRFQGIMRLRARIESAP